MGKNWQAIHRHNYRDKDRWGILTLSLKRIRQSNKKKIRTLSETVSQTVRERSNQQQPQTDGGNSRTAESSISGSARTSTWGCAGTLVISLLDFLRWLVSVMDPQGSWERHWATFPTSGPGLGTLKGTDTHGRIFLFLTETLAFTQLGWPNLDIYNLLLSD